VAEGTKIQESASAKSALLGQVNPAPLTPTAPNTPKPRLSVEVAEVSLAGILVVTSGKEKTFASDIK